MGEHSCRMSERRSSHNSSEIAGLVIDGLRSKSDNYDEADAMVLSPREREVVQLIAEGKTSKQVAETLNLSIKTIETHRSQVMRKLDIHNLAELTKYAIREGLTSI